MSTVVLVTEPDLLVRHASDWAAKKKRALDGDLLAEVVGLRLTYDEHPLGTWPAGSAERLVLVTWPAYGPTPPPDPDRLGETLDTFWGFLRATGRMSAGSASPAELRKEVRRALPKMWDACADPSRHSQGRVLGDFGRSIGIDMDSAADAAELQVRVGQIMAAWNSLPDEERLRLMPDPSPKSIRGERMTGAIARPPWPQPQEDDDEDVDLEPGDVRESARLARSSDFVAACLALADWVGGGRPVTSRGLLRPPVARDAYRHLDLWEWERGYERTRHTSYGMIEAEETPEVDQLLASAALNSWRSAGDCLPLDRLWFACDAADLVEIGGSMARRGRPNPESDEEWRDLALVLLIGLCLRLGWYAIEPMAGILLIWLASEDETVPFDAVRAWWDSRCPEQLRKLEFMHWQERLDLLLVHFADVELWRFEDDRYALTDLGRDFAIVFLNAVDGQLFDPGS